MTTPLHLVRLVLDRRQLMRVARQHRLGRNVDDGYLLHAGLAQLFATSREPARVPFGTFAVDDTLEAAGRQPERTFLLAYSEHDRKALVERMEAQSRALVIQCESRDFPELDAGTIAGFRVRTCPVIRTRETVGTGTTPRARGRVRELDAWLMSPEAQAGRDAGAGPNQPPFAQAGQAWMGREAAYGRWLGRELERDSAATLQGIARLTSFKRDRLYRKGAGASYTLERPNATLEGTLRVENGDAFRRLLTRGVGRHRAFGFGMLLLRQPHR